MDSPDSQDRYQIIGKEASRRAVASVEAMTLPKQVALPSALANVGPSVNRGYKKLLGDFEDEYADRLPFLVGLVSREIWFSAWRASHSMALMRLDEFGTELMPDGSSWTATRYIESEGWANTLYNELASIHANEARRAFLNGTPFDALLSQAEGLRVASLYWFSLSSAASAAGELSQASDWLHEAYDALVLENGVYMWDEATKLAEEEITNEATGAARTALAKTAAAARHSENRAMKKDVFRWCDANMASVPSMDAAASKVAGIVVPAAWRTVRDWMTEWKKLRSAGTA